MHNGGTCVARSFQLDDCTADWLAGMKRAFDTGATGFFGMSPVEQLVRSGWGITAYHPPKSNLERRPRWPVRLAQGDVTDARSPCASWSKIAVAGSRQKVISSITRCR